MTGIFPETPFKKTPSMGCKSVNNSLCAETVAEAQTSAPTGMESVSNEVGPGFETVLEKVKMLVLQ